VLDGLLHPRSSIPYVQMGRSIALYTVSLLSVDSFERAFTGQLVFLGFKFQLASFGASSTLVENEDVKIWTRPQQCTVTLLRRCPKI